MINCRSNPSYGSERYEVDATPFDHLLYSQPFCKFLILKAQVSNPFFIFDLLEQVGESI